MRIGSVSFSVTALQPHCWAVGLSYHRSRISLFFRIANADILATQIANSGEREVGLQIRPNEGHDLAKI